MPSLNVGDPAGRNRAPGKKTSIIEDLSQHGVVITTPQQKAQDYAVRILTNMMEADRVLVDKTHAARLGAAISSHRWKTDDNGIRMGTLAVHDWTSHYCDGLRYWATVMFSVFPRRDRKPDIEPPGPGTMGYMQERILSANTVQGWLGAPVHDPLLEWEPGLLVERDGRLYAEGA